ncbi:MAG: site-2 protease family protein [Oscillospiraceae bacterium]|nr:site-2 protease family protein [Oscillospiraceae bacterium]
MFKGPLLELFGLLFSSNRTNADIVSVVLSFFSVLVIIFVIFPIREFARGFVAKKLGDDTPEHAGRLTLNPFAHIDPMGALMMFLFRIGWSKHMPIDIRRCNKVKARTAVALTSLAGPLANILLSYLLIIICKILIINMTNNVVLYITKGFAMTAQISVFLAVFNLIPIPPFDGFNILATVLPTKVVLIMEKYQQVIYLAFFALLLFRVLDVPLGLASQGVMWLLDKASFFVPDGGFFSLLY